MALVSHEVANMVCSRLRSLPYCYIYCAKMQGLSLRCSQNMAKTELYSGRYRERRKRREELQVGCCVERLSRLLVTAL